MFHLFVEKASSIFDKSVDANFEDIPVAKTIVLCKSHNEKAFYLSVLQKLP